jgi:hypothetical protein
MTLHFLPQITVPVSSPPVFTEKSTVHLIAGKRTSTLKASGDKRTCVTLLAAGKGSVLLLG